MLKHAAFEPYSCYRFYLTGTHELRILARDHRLASWHIERRRYCDTEILGPSGKKVQESLHEVSCILDQRAGSNLQLRERI